MFIRTPYNYDRALASDAAALCSEKPSRTKQSFRDECDINTIVNRFLRQGVMPENLALPQYVELDAPLDFKTAMDFVTQSQQSFMELPPGMRKRFANDPGNLMEFLADPANVEESRKLGLRKVSQGASAAFAAESGKVVGSPEVAAKED